MLAKRIIPCLDILDGRVVKGIKFLQLRDAGDPVEAAVAYESQRADELVFLDITASVEARQTMLRVVERVARNIFMPFTVGGGIRNLSDIRSLLSAGADKVSINTTAVNDPSLIERASKRFGSQCIVVAIDAKKIEDRGQKTGGRKNKRPIAGLKTCLLTAKSRWEVFTHGGRTSPGLDAVLWAKKVQELGAGEILLTSMDCDGTKNGFDLPLTRAVGASVRIPVIASGGAGRKEHFFQVFSKAKADAALAASVFHFGELKVGQIKSYLKSKKVRVRL